MHISLSDLFNCTQLYVSIVPKTVASPVMLQSLSLSPCHCLHYLIYWTYWAGRDMLLEEIKHTVGSSAPWLWQITRDNYSSNNLQDRHICLTQTFTILIHFRLFHMILFLTVLKANLFSAFVFLFFSASLLLVLCFYFSCFLLVFILSSQLMLVCFPFLVLLI